MRKFLSILLTLCLFVNVSFAFDPYADEEIEKKSYKKLYYGIALTLLGGFLTYDGFSLEKVNTSRPSVDYVTVSHSEWIQITEDRNVYQLRSGYSDNTTAQYEQDYTKYKIDDQMYTVEPNVLYNNGNVDLTKITIEVAYKFSSGEHIGPGGERIDGDIYYDAEGNPHSVYHTAQYFNDEGNLVDATNINLNKGQSVQWQDIWEYPTGYENAPNNAIREPFYDPDAPGSSGEIPKNDGTSGLNLGKNSSILMDVRVTLKKNDQYKPIYQTKHKSDAEGVAGILVGLTGIYFIVDHFLDMHKFNAYVKRHHLNLRVATASNEYKLMLQKRI